MSGIYYCPHNPECAAGECSGPVTDRTKAKITIEELAEGKWTESGDTLGATWAELSVINAAKQILKGRETVDLVKKTEYNREDDLWGLLGKHRKSKHCKEKGEYIVMYDHTGYVRWGCECGHIGEWVK